MSAQVTTRFRRGRGSDIPVAAAFAMPCEEGRGRRDGRRGLGLGCVQLVCRVSQGRRGKPWSGRKAPALQCCLRGLSPPWSEAGSSRIRVGGHRPIPVSGLSFAPHWPQAEAVLLGSAQDERSEPPPSNCPCGPREGAGAGRCGCPTADPQGRESYISNPTVQSFLHHRSNYLCGSV